jgi:hypothetical protein
LGKPLLFDLTVVASDDLYAVLASPLGDSLLFDLTVVASDDLYLVASPLL